MIRSIEDVDLESLRVLVRADLDCPVVDGRVVDGRRIRAALPTLRLALKRRAKVVVMAHLGDPAGAVVERLSLEPVGMELAEMLGMEVVLADDCVGDGARKVVADLYGGRIALLENLRYHRGEAGNEEKLARGLADMAQVYVNDSFSTLHLPHASVVGVPGLVRKRCAGLAVTRELDALSVLRSAPESPFVALVGGGRLSQRRVLIRSLLERVDTMLMAGPVATAFLAARGLPVGDSPVEPGSLAHARSILEDARRRSLSILQPLDVVITGPSPRVVEVQDVPAGSRILDIGPRTRALYAGRLEAARTVLWNGTVGEAAGESEEGTRQLADAVGRSIGYKVVAGDETAATLRELGLESRFDHVSSGGEASLAFLEGGPMPGLRALEV